MAMRARRWLSFDARELDAMAVLTGERAHYELAAGVASAEALLGVMENSTEPLANSRAVWTRKIFLSASCLLGRRRALRVAGVAHSEYIKLRRSLVDGKILISSTKRGTLSEKETPAQYFNWRFNNKRGLCLAAKSFVFSCWSQHVHWSVDGWQTARDSDSEESGWNLQHVDRRRSACLGVNHLHVLLEEHCAWKAASMRLLSNSLSK